jgi:hypothetical protein
MSEEKGSIRVLRNQAAAAASEWAQEINDVNGHGIDLTYAEARAEHILEMIRAIIILKKASQ